MLAGSVIRTIPPCCSFPGCREIRPAFSKTKQKFSLNTPGKALPREPLLDDDGLLSFVASRRSKPSSHKTTIRTFIGEGDCGERTCALKYVTPACQRERAARSAIDLFWRGTQAEGEDLQALLRHAFFCIQPSPPINRVSGFLQARSA